LRLCVSQAPLGVRPFGKAVATRQLRPPGGYSEVGRDAGEWTLSYVSVWASQHETACARNNKVEDWLSVGSRRGLLVSIRFSFVRIIGFGFVRIRFRCVRENLGRVHTVKNLCRVEADQTAIAVVLSIKIMTVRAAGPTTAEIELASSAVALLLGAHALARARLHAGEATVGHKPVAGPHRVPARIRSAIDVGQCHALNLDSR
jgi:hypothetical protein